MSLLAVAVTLLLYYRIYRLHKKGSSFMVRILLATGLGAVVGLIFKGYTEYVAIFGRIYANLLQAFVIPLLIVSIISTVSSLKSTKELSSTGGKTIGFLALHNVLASILALIVGNLMQVGVGSTIKMDQAAEVNEVPPLSEVLISFFPKNLADSYVNMKIVPIVIFAIIIGLVVLKYENKEEIKPFTDFIRAADKVLGAVIGELVNFTPYAVISLLANQVSNLDLSFVTSLLWLLLAVYIACLFHTFVTSSILLRLVGKVNPGKYHKKFFPAWLIALTTQSSVGTMPANIKAQEDMGVPTDIASFSASIGTTFGMPGCAAIWPVLLSMFTIKALKLDFTTSQYIMMIPFALLASLGTVGVPGTATIAATALFSSLGLPVEMIIVLSPISGIADMIRTPTNVHAAGSTGVIVASLQKELDRDKYNA